ncbi:MAG TPA: hypothetical protein DDW54_03825 [Clostridiales bacterium]|nr:hypothetical protein [Clostridiales bacterium]
MKRTFRILLSVFLAAIVFAAAVACNKKGPSQNAGGDDEEKKSDLVFTDDVLAENGTTEYKIVVSEDAGKYANVASQELQLLFKEATGATLPVITDEDLEYSPDMKLLAIGNGKVKTAWNVETSYDEYKYTGVRIVTKDRSLLLTGFSDEGAIYAVYDLMELLFGYDYYEERVYEINKVNKINLPVLDYKNIPDFDIREFGDVSSCIEYGGNELNGWRQRFRSTYGVTALGGHTNAEIINPEVYAAEHPEWFWPRGSTDKFRVQLCLTDEALTEEYIKNAKNYLNKTPEATEISFTQVDINTWCECDRCKALMTKYGTNGSPNGMAAVTQILFLNKVTAALDEWLAENYPGRIVSYYTYAYHQTVIAPAHKDESGKYVANGTENGDNSLILNPRVVVRLADIYANRNLSWEDNPATRENIQAWSAITKNVSIYEYPQDALNVCMPYDGMHVHADNIRFAHSLGHSNYKLQGVYGTVSSGFYNLRRYVCSKLLWDCSLDARELAYRYIDKVYGSAASYMKELYDAERDRMAYLRETKNYGSFCLFDNVRPEFWPRKLMVQYQAIIDKAYDAINNLQYIDAERYDIIFRKIKTEEMFVKYVNLDLYRQYLSAEEKKKEIDEFEYWAPLLGFSRWSETLAMSERIAKWRAD